MIPVWITLPHFPLPPPKNKKRKGGTVKRKRGGKIMVGYKAGGKV